MGVGGDPLEPPVCRRAPAGRAFLADPVAGCRARGAVSAHRISGREYRGARREQPHRCPGLPLPLERLARISVLVELPRRGRATGPTRPFRWECFRAKMKSRLISRPWERET